MLKENNLESVNAKAFQNFEYVNFTSLAGNPIRAVGADGFSETQIKHLDLSNCLIHQMSPLAFKGN